MASFRLSTVLCLALFSGVLATPRLVLPAQTKAVEQAEISEVSALDPDDPSIKNDRPLIGILAQACHSCPGKYVLQYANAQLVILR